MPRRDRRQLRQRRTRPRATASFEDAARMQGAAVDGRRRARGAEVAVASTGVIGVPLDARRRASAGSLAPVATCAGTATATSPRRSAPRTSAEEIEVDVALPSGTVRLTAQAKGAGMISPRSRRCSASSRPTRCWRPRPRDLLLGAVRGALVRPHLRRRPALHQRHRDPAGVRAPRAWSSAAIRGRGALRRGARLGAAASWRWTSSATARAQADRPHGGRRRGDEAGRRRASRGRSPTRRW